MPPRIQPLQAPLAPEFMFERRELFAAGSKRIVRKTEYRLDAARAVPDFSTFIECWDQCQQTGSLPTFRDFERVQDTSSIAAIHLVDASASNPNLFRFLRFDRAARAARSDDRDLSGTSLAEYPDSMIGNSCIQDYATTAFANRGTVMDVTVTTNGEARRFARLLLPIASDKKQSRPNQLISIVRLLEYKKQPICVEEPEWGGDMKPALSRSPAQMAFNAAPTRNTARQLLMKHFHSGNQELLADQDLLELLIRQSDDSTQCQELAELLIQEFGSLAAVMAIGNERLIHFPGMTPQALVRIKVARELATRMIRLEMIDKPVFSGTGVVLDYCRARMAHETVEHVRMLYLDQKNRLISDEPVHGGGVASVPVNPRQIVKRAVILDAQSIVIAHNHPSGDPSPSGADVDVTLDLKRAAEAVGIKLLDHLIIGRSGHVSLRTLGYLEDA